MQLKRNAELRNLFKLLEKITTKIKNIKALKLRKAPQGFNDEPDSAQMIKDRKYVGNIIIAVLTERITVQRGLLLFPKGFTDPSIRAAWHAVCHYEADEDIKKQDVEYNNQQIELLEMIAFAFKDGNPLPQNIIDSYKPFYADAPISYESGLKGLVKRLLRFINL